jgi:hypothetical protein
MDECLRTVDRELPGVTGDVPVELVEVLEETDLPVRTVDDQVSVRAARNDDIGRADPDALTVLSTA